MPSALYRIAWFAVALAGFGCAVKGGPSGSTMPAPNIELLGTPGCPHTGSMRANLRAALTSIDRAWKFKDTNQETLPAADVRRGYGAPTILVDGRDLFGLPVPTAPAMSCRIYEGGTPDAAEIASRVRQRIGAAPEPR